MFKGADRKGALVWKCVPPYLRWYVCVYAFKREFEVAYGFPGDAEFKASARNAENLGLIPRLGRSPGGGNGNPL